MSSNISKPDAIYTDLEFARTADGFYDLVIDTETSDMAVTDGFESAIMVSVFSDRRANEDEVADPIKRRGWIGDLVSDVPDDRHGSGLWLYEQRRLDPRTVVGLRLEAEASLRWMIQEGLVKSVSASVAAHPDKRSTNLTIAIVETDGGQSKRAFVIAEKTKRRSITNQS